MAHYSDLERAILAKSLTRLQGAVPEDLLGALESAINSENATLTAEDVRRLIRESVVKELDADS